MLDHIVFLRQYHLKGLPYDVKKLIRKLINQRYSLLKWTKNFNVKELR
jgi:hypothetical protein